MIGAYSYLLSTRSAANATVPSSLTIRRRPQAEGEYGYVIKVNFKHIRQIQAQIVDQGGFERAVCPVEWEFPILSKQRLRQLLVSSSAFEVKVEKQEEGFRVFIISDQVNKEILDFMKNLNAKQMVDREEIQLWVTLYQEQDDEFKKEFQKLLLGVIKKAELQKEYLIAATNSRTILQVLNIPIEQKESDFSGINLSNSTLENCSFSQANFRKAILRASNLIKVTLKEADLGEVDLSNATVRDVNFEHSNLKKANCVSTTWLESDLVKADCTEIDLSGATITKSSFTQACLKRAKVCQVTLTESDLAESDCTEIDLSGASISKCNFNRACLTKAKIAATLLTKSHFTETDCTEIDLSGATLEDVDLRGAVFKRAKLTNAILCRVKLDRINLTDADLTGATLREVSFKGAILRNTNLTGVILIATHLREINLKEVRLDTSCGLRGSRMLKLRSHSLSSLPAYRQASAHHYLLAFAKLRGSWKERPYEIKLNFNRIDQPTLKVLYQGQTYSGSVRWGFPILSKKRLQSYIRSGGPFEVKITKKSNKFTAFIICHELKAETDQIIEELNKELFTWNHSMLQFWIDIYHQEDKEIQGFYQRFFFEIIETTKSDKSKHIAAANAITILNLVQDVSFSGRDLSGVSVPYANLSGACFERTNLNAANLDSARLEGACLLHASLESASLKEIELGLLPEFLHTKKVLNYCFKKDQLFVLTRQEFYIWNLTKNEPVIITAQYLKSLFVVSDHILVLNANNNLSVRTIDFLTQVAEIPMPYKNSNISISLDENLMFIWDHQELAVYNTSKARGRFSLDKKLYAKACTNLAMICFSSTGDYAFIERLAQESRKREDPSVQPVPRAESPRVSSPSIKKAKSQLSMSASFMEKLLPAALIRIQACSSSGNQLAEWKMDTEIKHLQFSSDGQSLLGVQDNIVWQWNIQTREQNFLFEAPYAIDHLALIPAGHYKNHYVYTFHRLICIRNVHTQRDVCRYHVNKRFSSLQVSEDGEFVFAVLQDTIVNRWRIDFLARQGITIDNQMKNFYYSFDSKLIFSLPSENDFLKPYYVNKAEHNYPSLTSYTYEMNIYDVFSNHVYNQKLVVPLPEDKTTEEVRVLDPLMSQDTNFAIFRFEDKQTEGLVAAKHYFYLWSIEENRERWSCEFSAVKSDFAMDSTNSHVVFFRKSHERERIEEYIDMWGVESNERVMQLNLRQLMLKRSYTTCSVSVAMTPRVESKGYIALDLDMQVVIIRLEGVGKQTQGKLVNASLPSSNQALKKMQFCQRDKMTWLFLLKKKENFIHCWNDQRGEFFQCCKSSKEIVAFDISPDHSKIVYINKGRMLSLWDIEGEREEIPTTPLHHAATKVKFSPDGLTVAIYNEETQTFYIWEKKMEEGQEKGFHLLWMYPKQLVCDGTTIRGATIEDVDNERLLKQLGAIT